MSCTQQEQQNVKTFCKPNNDKIKHNEGEIFIEFNF